MSDPTDTVPDAVALIVHAEEVIRQLAARLLSVGALTLDDLADVLSSFPQVDA